VFFNLVPELAPWRKLFLSNLFWVARYTDCGFSWFYPVHRMFWKVYLVEGSWHPLHIFNQSWTSNLTP
jgi:hypothetical protein